MEYADESRYNYILLYRPANFDGGIYCRADIKFCPSISFKKCFFADKENRTCPQFYLKAVTHCITVQSRTCWNIIRYVSIERSKRQKSYFVISTEGRNLKTLHFKGAHTSRSNHAGFLAALIMTKGLNGSGKTTLVRIILSEVEPVLGNIYRASIRSVYIDQEYSLINNRLKVYEQAIRFNLLSLQEHEIKIRLSRFLFTKEYWDKPCQNLSGGERMRLMLCCMR